MKTLRIILTAFLAFLVVFALASVADFAYNQVSHTQGTIMGLAAIGVVFFAANHIAQLCMGGIRYNLGMQAVESTQVGKREALADTIANIEADSTQFTSMAAKRKKPGNVEQSWQLKAYRRKGHRGVRDGVDAKNFTNNGRDRISAIGQKTWDPRAVSDFAEESNVAGLKSGELAEQTADAMVTVKQTIERRALSFEDCKRETEDDQNSANETRGMFNWLDSAAQALHPVPDKFRPGADQVYTGALAGLKESVLKGLARAAWKRRLGNSVKMKGFVGIDMKAQISEFTRYDDTVADKVAVRTFKQDADSKALINVIDRLVFDTGTIDLFASAHIMTDPDTGEDTAYTHKSGIFVDMDMIGLSYTRMPRAFPIEYKGGGYKVIVDAIFTWLYDNPGGGFSARCNS